MIKEQDKNKRQVLGKSKNEDVIFKRGWMFCWRAGALFSVFFMLLYEFVFQIGADFYFTWNIRLFAMACCFFGFAFAIRLVFFIFEKKYGRLRKIIKDERKLICDGYADYLRKQNGWLFFTEQGFEYYPCRLNFLSKNIVIPMRLVQAVETTGDKLIIRISEELSYEFIVSHNNLWKRHIDEYLTNEKQEKNNYEIDIEPVFGSFIREDFVKLSKEDKYVFISYGSENQAQAEAMRFLLKEKGIKNWMAPYDIPAGSKYAFVINDAIENSTCVLFLLSEDSQSSQFVQREIERAVAYNKPVISMKIDDCRLNAGFKFFIGSEQIIPVKEIDVENYYVKKIIESLEALVNI